jgi:hypothetical protein
LPRAKEGMAGSEFNKESFFSAWMWLFTVNLFLLTTWSTLDFYCHIWRHLRENVQRRGLDLGATITASFIMSTCPPTHPWKPQSLWLTTTCLLFPILPTCQS